VVRLRKALRSAGEEISETRQEKKTFLNTFKEEGSPTDFGAGKKNLTEKGKERQSVMEGAERGGWCHREPSRSERTYSNSYRDMQLPED